MDADLFTKNMNYERKRIVLQEEKTIPAPMVRSEVTDQQ